MSRFAAVETIPLVTDRHGVHLDHDTAKSWKLFEHSIRSSAAHLLTYYKSLGSQLDIFWKDPPKPGAGGYFDPAPNPDEFRRRLQVSVDYFVVYTAYLSFLTAVCLFSPFRKDGAPSTLSELWEAANIAQSFEYQTGLLESGVGAFNVDRRRIGLIVDVSLCSWLNAVPIFIAARVPVWFYWSHANYSGKLWICSFSPTNDQSPPADHSFLTLPSFPPVERNSTQLLGETWQDFFSRRAAHVRGKTFSDAQLRAMRNQKAQMANHPEPGRRCKFKIFHWDKVDGFRIRAQLSIGVAQVRWATFKASERIFDPYYSEWDLCHEFNYNPDKRTRERDIFSYDVLLAPTIQAEPQNVPRPSVTAPPVTTNSLSLISSSHHDHEPLGPVERLPGKQPGNPFSNVPTYNTEPLRTPAPMPPAAACSAKDLPSSVGQLPDQQAVHLRGDDVSMGDVEPYHGPPSAPPMDDSEPRHSPAPPAAVNPTEKLPGSGGQLQNEQTDRSQGDVPMEDIASQHSLVYPQDLANDDIVTGSEAMLGLSQADFLSANPVSATPDRIAHDESIEDLIYHRYGYYLSQIPYEGLPDWVNVSRKAFQHWEVTCRAIGGGGLSVSEDSRRPIADFLVALSNANRPFHGVPGFFWDLSHYNDRPLNDHAVKNVLIDVKKVGKEPLYILRPNANQPIRDTPWAVCVQPMIALECVRRELGPHSLDLVDFLTDHGISFRTLQPILPHDIPMRSPTPQKSSSPFLGTRRSPYNFDLVDFVTYETRRNAYLAAKPFARRALSRGGVVARIAREILPNSVLYAGPSDDALMGNQLVLDCGDECLVDDMLSNEDLDFICGTYNLTGGGRDSEFFYLVPYACLLIVDMQTKLHLYPGFLATMPGLHVD